MATQQLNFAGYFFGVEVDGKVTEYPNYDMACTGAGFRRTQGQEPKLKMRAAYTTPWTDANDVTSGNVSEPSPVMASKDHDAP